MIYFINEQSFWLHGRGKTGSKTRPVTEKLILRAVAIIQSKDDVCGWEKGRRKRLRVGA